jgi:hypothetical protein
MQPGQRCCGIATDLHEHFYKTSVANRWNGVWSMPPYSHDGRPRCPYIEPPTPGERATGAQHSLSRFGLFAFIHDETKTLSQRADAVWDALGVERGTIAGLRRELAECQTALAGYHQSLADRVVERDSLRRELAEARGRLAEAGDEMRARWNAINESLAENRALLAQLEAAREALIWIGEHCDAIGIPARTLNEIQQFAAVALAATPSPAEPPSPTLEKEPSE